MIAQKENITIIGNIRTISMAEKKLKKQKLPGLLDEIEEQRNKVRLQNILFHLSIYIAVCAPKNYRNAYRSTPMGITR